MIIRIISLIGFIKIKIRTELIDFTLLCSPLSVRTLFLPNKSLESEKQEAGRKAQVSDMPGIESHSSVG